MFMWSHKDPLSWFRGATERGFKKPWFAGSFCLYGLFLTPKSNQLIQPPSIHSTLLHSTPLYSTPLYSTLLCFVLLYYSRLLYTLYCFFGGVPFLTVGLYSITLYSILCILYSILYTLLCSALLCCCTILF